MKLTLQLDLRMTLLSLCVLPILISLGFWQLNRAEEKRQILQQLESRLQQAPVELEQLPVSDDLAFTPVKLQGEFDDSRNFLLDNRIYQGQVGYEVLTPFRTTTGMWVMVNRGWVKAPPTRAIKPDVPTSNAGGETEIVGQIYQVPGEIYQLEEQTFTDVSWPLVIQAVETEKFQRFFDATLFPYEIRINAEESVALTPNWTAVAVSPAKHLGYAVQWFSMSIGLIIWFIFSQTNLWLIVKGSAEPKSDD